METCAVCVENYNRSTRFPVPCGQCDFLACRQCYETYLLQHPTPRCMGCARLFSRDDLVSKFSKKFIAGSLKTHRERCLFDMEKAMLPATQPIVERILEDERVHTRIREYTAQIHRLRGEIRRLEDRLSVRSTNPQGEERRAFVRKCPNSECRGFLSTQWKCNLCERRTCKECNECIVALEEHKCDPANVETVKLLAKDSKACPKCGELIFKIDGCDQMYCVQCHTAFSWRTGRIEVGNVHNPHYFEWLRKNNQTANHDTLVRCGRELDNYFLVRVLRPRNCQTAMYVARGVLHIREVELPRYRTDHFADNQDLRVQFLRQTISEEYFQRTLQKREKAREKKQEYHRLFAMVVQCITEILYRYADEVPVMTETVVEKPNAETYFEPYYAECLNLLVYVNECLERISKVFGSQRYYITPEMELAHFRSF